MQTYILLPLALAALSLAAPLDHQRRQPTPSLPKEKREPGWWHVVVGGVNNYEEPTMVDTPEAAPTPIETNVYVPKAEDEVQTEGVAVPKMKRWKQKSPFTGGDLKLPQPPYQLSPEYTPPPPYQSSTPVTNYDPEYDLETEAVAEDVSVVNKREPGYYRPYNAVAQPVVLPIPTPTPTPVVTPYVSVFEGESVAVPKVKREPGRKPIVG